MANCSSRPTLKMAVTQKYTLGTLMKTLIEFVGYFLYIVNRYLNFCCLVVDQAIKLGILFVTSKVCWYW
jgi:hypothetical protein